MSDIPYSQKWQDEQALFRFQTISPLLDTELDAKKKNSLRQQIAQDKDISTTDLIIGKPIEEALNLSNKAVVEALDGLPTHKIHCSVLAEQAVRAAVKDYYDRKGIEYNAADFVFPEEDEEGHVHES